MKTILLSVFCCFLFFACKQEANKEYSNKMNEINSVLPARFGNEMVLEKVQMISKTECKFYYKLLKSPDMTQEEFIQKERDEAVHNIRKDRDRSKLKKDKIVFIYSYRNLNNTLYTEIRIAPDEY